MELVRARLLHYRPRAGGATYRGDGRGVLLSLGDSIPETVLQLAGDGLLVAVAQSVDDASELASQCASALRHGGFVGDEELATELEAALGVGEASALLPVPVDLEELSELLEADLGSDGGRLDIRSGEVGSEEGYRDMRVFIGGLSNPDQVDRLLMAIDGRGAFRRFRQTLARWPEEGHR